MNFLQNFYKIFFNAALEKRLYVDFDQGGCSKDCISCTKFIARLRRALHKYSFINLTKTTFFSKRCDAGTTLAYAKLSKKGGRVSPYKKRKSGFSFLEVIGAMMIVAIALIALMQNQTSSISLSRKALYMDTATSLAEAKMAELSDEVNRVGFKAFPDQGKGEFEQDNFKNYSWNYRTREVAAPDFAAMASSLGGGTEADAGGGQGNGGMLDGPLKNITETWSKAFLQLRVEINWTEGSSKKAYALTTHLMDANVGGLVDGLIGALAGGIPGGGDQEKDEEEK